MTLLYAVWFDLDPSAEAPFATWVGEEHLPDMAQAGFDSAQCYRSRIGEPAVLDLYELPDLGVFTSERYRSVGTTTSKSLGDVGIELRNHVVSIYRVLGSGPRPPAYCTTSTLVTVRTHADETQAARWLDEGRDAIRALELPDPPLACSAAWYAGHPDGTRETDPRSAFLSLGWDRSARVAPTDEGLVQLAQYLRALAPDTSVNVLELTDVVTAG